MSKIKDYISAQKNTIISDFKEAREANLKVLIKWLEGKLYKWTHKPVDGIFNSLSPIDDADKENNYYKAILWALENCRLKDIKNIALTGPYGSGKSSILKTFQTKYKGNDFKFLNISLATFKEDATLENTGETTENKKELLRLIEVSILQQIFYHEEDKQIPDSRLKKIKSHSSTKIAIVSVLTILYIASISILKYPNLPDAFLLEKYYLLDQTKNVIKAIAIFFSVVGTSILVGKIIRRLSSLRLNKLTFQDTEIEIEQNPAQSILNHHIDELIYFFQVTRYNVVIIEDLDRFKQTEIFTKLREINLLLNNSKQVNKTIVFIYAVRDDMFADKERPKFFDFIIPVIPVINTSNSAEKLLKKRDEHGYKWSDDLVNDLAIFIDDMRMLHNITNEFHLYYQLLSKDLSQNNLLAILAYKNIYPYDFTLLTSNEGKLFKVISGKVSYIQNHVSAVEEKIKQLRNEITDLENLQLVNANELRSIYITKLLSDTRGFESFLIDGVSRKIKDVVESEEYFDSFIAGEAQYRYVSNSYTNLQTESFRKTFSQIENEVDPKFGYKERLTQIVNWKSNRVEKARNEIQKLTKEKIEIRSHKLKDLIPPDSNLLPLGNGPENQLIHLLIRNGYIDENYFDYISIFYEGSITKADHQFLLNVKAQRITEFTFQLNKIGQLIKKIGIHEFNKDYVLNYDLVDFILTEGVGKEYAERIFNKLSDGSELSFTFIDGMIDTGTNVDVFINVLCNKWPDIWDYIETTSNITTERRNNILGFILDFADNEDIKEIANRSDLIEYILCMPTFLTLIPNEERTKEIIDLLELEFREIREQDATGNLLEYIYLHNRYALNHEMVKLIIRTQGDFNSFEYENRNYKAILNSKAPELIEYVQSDINSYVQDIYLNLPSNANEDADALVQLLNHPQITLENALKVIAKTQTIVESLDEITDVEVQAGLISFKKVKATWDSIFRHLRTKAGEVSSETISYIDTPEFLSWVSGTSMPKGGDAKEQSENTAIIKTLLGTNDISDGAYKVLVPSSPYSFNEFDLKELSATKVAIMISGRRLNLTKSNYEALKAKADDTHVLLIELNPSYPLEKLLELDLNNEDYRKLIASRFLSQERKQKIIASLIADDEDNVISDEDLTMEIGREIIRNASLEITNNLLQALLTLQSYSSEERIKIFNLRFSELGREFIDEFVRSLQEPYNYLANTNLKPGIPLTPDNIKFAGILKENRYISSFQPKEKKGLIRIYHFVR